MVKPARFDAKWQRRRAWRRRWRVARFWLLAVFIIAASWWVTRGSFAAGEWQAVDQRFTLCAERRSAACVIDGDTIMIGQRRIRLTGFDAPELAGDCRAERQLALAARGALLDWLNRGSVLMDGGTDPPRDDYGRELRAVRRAEAGGDEWLTDYMTDKGLARTSDWGVLSQEWCVDS